MSQQGSVRKRKDGSVVGKAKEPAATGIAALREPDLDALVKANMEIKAPGVEWNYRIAITLITILAFVTRFWGISHPNEVVFDEVHFGKVMFTLPNYPEPGHSANISYDSLRPIISNEHTSSMFTLLLGSFSSP
jgi:hypothetical protein